MIVKVMDKQTGAMRRTTQLPWKAFSAERRCER